MHRARRLALLLAATAAGCAGPAPDPADPFEPANRRSYALNQRFDDDLLAPAARGYRAAVPGPVRRSLGNALANLGAPSTFANDLLQGNPSCAGQAALRFVLNSVAGLGGLIDVGARAGIPPHQSDFGQTLGVWGVPSGPYIFWAGLGPSNPRDSVGFLVDLATDPFNIAAYRAWGYGPPLGRFGLEALDLRERNIETLADLKRNSLDPYAVRRSVARQSRAADIDRGRAAHRAGEPAGCGAS